MKRRLRGAQKKIKSGVLKKRPKEARADHLVKRSTTSGRRKPKRMPLSELFVNGEFTEDRAEWQKELQRHCEGVCSDLDESREFQRRERFAW